MAKNRIPVGTKVKAFGKSLHAGHKGTVLADYGQYYLVKAEDQKYSNAHKMIRWDNKCFQIDERYITTAKD